MLFWVWEEEDEAGAREWSWSSMVSEEEEEEEEEGSLLEEMEVIQPLVPSSLSAGTTELLVVLECIISPLLYPIFGNVPPSILVFPTYFLPIYLLLQLVSMYTTPC